MTCQRCGAALAPGAQFCSTCGIPVSAAAPRPGAAPGAVPPPPPMPPMGPPPPGAPPLRGALPPRQGGGAIKVVLIVVGALLVLPCILGILAAIAIPNFLRYQLRAKSAEGRATVAEVTKAELAYGERNGRYLGLAVPQGKPGSAKLAWSAEDLQAARELDWVAEGASYFTYRVAVGTTDAGKPAFAVCAESDLDADGQVAAVVAFQPAPDSGGALVAPEAPCQHGPQLDAGKSLSWSDGDPVAAPVKVSPENVF